MAITKRLRIPAQVRLPFGYTVRVKQVSDSVMEQIDLGDCDGAWVIDSRTIWIRESLSHPEKVITFSHELVHALNDWTFWASKEAGKRR